MHYIHAAIKPQQQQPQQHNMQKYEVEDDSHVDFFAALKNLKSSPSQAETSDKEVCLITHTPLDAFHVKLVCGHKFNYVPLYQEVLRQKGRIGTIGMNHYYEKIGMNQIKCPYCRGMNNSLLPFIGNNPHPIIKRLISINAPASLCMAGVPCNHTKCSSNAFYQHDEFVYCYKHYQKALNPKPIPKPKAHKATKTTKTTNSIDASNRCIAENQTGKNKGKQCKITAMPGAMLCNVHSKCNAITTTGAESTST